MENYRTNEQNGECRQCQAGIALIGLIVAIAFACLN